MLSSETPLVGLYMIIAVLLVNKQVIMETVSEVGELVLFINSFKFDTDSVSKAIAKCNEIVYNERKRNIKEHKKNVKKQPLLRRSVSARGSVKTSGTFGNSLNNLNFWNGLKKVSSLTTKAMESVSVQSVKPPLKRFATI